MARKPHVFVVGLNDFLERELRTIPRADRYHFHRLFDEREVVHKLDYDIPALIDDAMRRIDQAHVPVDALITHWDFPVTSLVPLLQHRLGLPGPDLESVSKCTNKYWSRLEQKRLVPECTPDFQLLDPFADGVEERVELDYPFWLKPVKGYASQYNYRIENPEELRRGLAEIREGLPKLRESYNHLQRIMLGADHPHAEDGDYVLIEELIGGRELAPEGSVHRGRIDVHGIIDMPRVELSFDRYQYPAEIDADLERRMIDVCERLIGGIGYDDGCFNIEFFHDQERDRLQLVEVNPRISQSHCYLFEMVDGVSNHAVATAVALGHDPEMPRGEGPYGSAAKCLLRRWEDGVVRRVPTAGELEELRSEFPDCRISMLVEEGQRLSELEEQDAYSYNYAVLCVAGEDEADMLAKRRAIEDALPFEVDPT